MKDISANTSSSGNPLGYAPVLGLIGKFAIPSIISMLVAAAYNITDQIFIGRLVGMLGNGATSVAFPVVTFTTAFAQLIGVELQQTSILIWVRKERRRQSILSEQVLH